MQPRDPLPHGRPFGAPAGFACCKLDHHQRALPAAMHRRTLPIVEPCHEDWERMIPAGEHRRLCQRCDKHVHFLSGMTEAEARGLLAGAGESMCLRYECTSDGSIVFAVPSVVSESPWRMVAGLTAMLLVGCAEPLPTPREGRDVGDRAALLWVEPVIPDLVLPCGPIEQHLADAAGPDPKPKKKKKRREKLDTFQGDKVKLDTVQGDPLGWNL